MNPLLRAGPGRVHIPGLRRQSRGDQPEFAPWVQAAQKQAEDLKHIIVTEKDDIPGAIYYDTLVSDQPDSLEIEETDNDDTAALIYTAGTTGPNKG